MTARRKLMADYARLALDAGAKIIGGWLRHNL